MEDTNGKKILYLLASRAVKPARFIEIYRSNNGDLEKTLKFFLKYKALKLKFEDDEENPGISSEDGIFSTEAVNCTAGKGVGLLDIGQDSYPDILKNIYSPPPLLFFKGDKIKEAKFCIAVVGSRKCTAYGKEAARYISKNLSRMGITVVSGVAIGVDSCAHEAALGEKGGTIGVLGCGIDIIYPPENKYLYENIPENGSIVTEFIPGTPPLKSNFPVRNRIISGLCKGTVVIEAGEKSGAIITGEMALRQNREVFAVPGNIFNAMSRGCHWLIKNGAKLVEKVDDILEEFTIYSERILKSSEGCRGSSKQAANSEIQKGLTAGESRVYEFLGYRPKSVEEIVRDIKMDVREVLRILTLLEIKKLIREDSFNKYSRLF